MVCAEQGAVGAVLPAGQLQRRGEFIAQEACADTDEHVMPRDFAEPQQEVQRLSLPQMQGSPCWLAREEESAGWGDAGGECGEGFAVEMMQEEIRDDDLGVRPRWYLKEVRLMPRRTLRPAFRSRRQVQRGPMGGGMERGLPELSIACADFQHAVGFAELRAEDAAQPAVIAHELIDPPQLASALHGRRISGRQGIEHFWLDEAEHGSVKRATSSQGEGMLAFAERGRTFHFRISPLWWREGVLMRTRFAPSPTGWLHLGHAFAARVAYEEARRAGGEFLLRLEDIDGPRCRVEFAEGILEDVARLGLEWSGPVWKQSERMPFYEAALECLQQRGVLYRCFCTRQEIASLAAPQGPEGPLYPGTCRELSRGGGEAELLHAGRAFAWRLNAAEAARQAGALTWTDVERGTFSAQPELLGDVVLARKDIATSYHLAVTVDDAAQGITLVTRGEDLLASTHVHRLLQALLDLPVPQWKHHRLICDKEGRRLAKRDEARSLRSLWEAGWSSRELWEL